MTCTQDWCPHVTVAAIVEDENRFLMVEEFASGKRVINQPAGHLDDDESLLDAVVRETLEETRWSIKPLHVCGVYRWRNPKNQQTFIRVAVAAKAMHEFADAPLDKGIIAAHWFSREELVEREHLLRAPLVMKCIDDYLAGKQYPLELLQDL